nr:unnamed protein product [Callosobruchus chinensis]
MPRNELLASDRTRIIALWQEELSRHQIANSPQRTTSHCTSTKISIPENWARGHQGWLFPQWWNMLFSDVSRFGLVGDDYRERVWRERGGQKRVESAIGVAPYRGGMQMFWAGIRFNGRT